MKTALCEMKKGSLEYQFLSFILREQKKKLIKVEEDKIKEILYLLQKERLDVGEKEKVIIFLDSIKSFLIKQYNEIKDLESRLMINIFDIFQANEEIKRIKVLLDLKNIKKEA
jgi:UDP-N-acetylglucosamine:LPS N-acetylglucosamine transferase